MNATLAANSTDVSRLLRRTSLDDAALTARHLQPSPRLIAPDENSRAAGDPDTTRPPPDSPHARERCGSADLRSLRVDDVRSVGEPVDDGLRESGVWEYLGPFSERQVGGDDQAGAFVSLGEDLEDELGGAVGQRQVAQLVADKKLG